MKYNPHDTYYKKAKHEGYRSRAAYKLMELNQRFHLFHPGDTVVDLGSAPGGWMQVAAKLLGPKGKVVGVDLESIQAMPQHNIIFIQGDITGDGTTQMILERLGQHADCVISDLSPKLSGIRDADDARCLELNRMALRVAIRLLRLNGNFLVKSFVSEELRTFSAELEKYFRSVQRTRPEASRRGSSEIYLFAKALMSTPQN